MSSETPKSGMRHSWLVPCAFLVIGSLVISLTYDDYGVMWDDSVHAEYGERVLDYFRSGTEDKSANEVHNLRFYGPAFDALAALAYQHIPEKKYEVRHLLAAVFGLLTALGVIRIGATLGHPGVGAWAGLFLVLTPRFYGHAFLNSKDTPFACLLTWSVWTLLQFLEHRRWRDAVLCGLAFGGALAVRPGGVLILMLLFAGTLGFLAIRHQKLPTARKAWVIWAIAWACMVAPWPYAHESPFLNPIRAIATSVVFPFSYDVLFDGRVVQSDQLPRTYLPHFLWITTPLVILALGAVGLGWSFFRRRDPADSSVATAVFALQLWLLLPYLWAVVSSPNVYDGLRHVLFTLPALAIFAGLGASVLVRRHGRLRWIRVVILLALAGVPGYQLFHLHPYQATYFNEWVGGVAGAQGDYETDYWATSYREAVQWINAREAQGDEDGVTILVAANDFSAECARYYLNPRTRMEITFGRPAPGSLPERFDYYLATTRYRLDEGYPDSPVVRRVGRGGATFAVIRAPLENAKGVFKFASTGEDR